MLNMITSVRPAMDARAVNTDYKSVVQTKLANGILDYYMRDKRLEYYFKTAVEMAIVLGSGYIKAEWNATSGEVYDVSEEGTDIFLGDIEFTNMSPFDVIFDTAREDLKHDWLMCRSWKNRYDVVAKYPEYEDDILRLPTKTQLENYYFDTFYSDSSDLIPVYEFYHRRSESMPDGRYLLFLSDNVVLLDSPMPYRNLPVYRIAPSTILGTPFGYTPMFDILPIADAINSLYSTILTNQTAFGVQNITVPKGGDVSISELAGGLNIIEFNSQFGEIKPLQLTATPKEVFDFLGMLEKAAETISGVNSVARGNPDPQLRSGNALALIQSMTLQFMSGLQQSYVSMIEDVGTGIINMLKDYAVVPRMAMITGRANRSYMKEFTGDDLSSINRVIVDIGNPLARTTAGRVEMAEQLLQMKIITTAQEYLNVINTGNLDLLTEDTQQQLYLVKAENERMVDGSPVIAIATDDHDLHIKEHSGVLSDPEMRFNVDLVTRVLGHIQEHMTLLRGMKQTPSGNQADPDYLKIMGEQPLSPPQGTPANQPNQMPPANSMHGQVQNAMGGMNVNSQLNPSTMAPNVRMPQPAKPPMVNGAPLPSTPQQQFMANNIGKGG